MPAPLLSQTPHCLADLLPRVLAGIKVDANGCWLWAGSVARPQGYGVINARLEDEKGPAPKYCHRITYEARHGAIPPNLEIDHKCRVRRCVNPAHLEAVTHAENVRRAMRDTCSRGHVKTPETTMSNGPGRRTCRLCKQIRRATYQRQAEVLREAGLRPTDFMSLN